MDTIITEKKCNHCHKEKAIGGFSKCQSSPDGKARQCKECDSEHSKKYYRAHVKERLIAGKEYYGKNPDAYRNSRYKIRYGITLEQYNQLFKNQNGVCAICGNKEERYKHLMIDHNHKTNKVRGLVCTKCNLALGYMEDNIYKIQNMIKYLIDND